MKEDILIVELGAGTGAFTKQILSRLPATGMILAFEINHQLAEHLRMTILDRRFTVIEDDATLIGEYLSRLSPRRADCIVSGLPLGDFTRAKRQRLLSAIRTSLDDDGLYIQFQYLLASLLHIRTMFDARIVGYELRNIPPAFLYECRKRATLIQ
jgi:phospholipid N-methyltransferase